MTTPRHNRTISLLSSLNTPRSIRPASSFAPPQASPSRTGTLSGITAPVTPLSAWTTATIPSTPSTPNSHSHEGGAHRESIKLYVRSRPLIVQDQPSADIAAGFVGESVVRMDGSRRIVSLMSRGEEKKRVACDETFDQDATQADIYASIGSPFVESLLNGYSGCIFAYGQTGSGKSWTMQGGNGEDRGLIPRLLDETFERIAQRTQENQRYEYHVGIEFIELYGEALHDLLAPPQAGPAASRTLEMNFMGSNGRYTATVPGLSKRYANTSEEALNLLEQGHANRRIDATPLNERSSRSHAIFILTLEVKDTLSARTVVSKFNLIDLAGSESQKSAVTEGRTRKEGVNINLSLSALSKVLQDLQERKNVIPWRTSKLTMLLAESLAGRSKTALIATLNPDERHLQHTLSTLQFAERARSIKTEVGQNASIGGNMMDMTAMQKRLNEMKKENNALKQKLATLGTDGVVASTTSSPSSSGDMQLQLALLDRCVSLCTASDSQAKRSALVWEEAQQTMSDLCELMAELEEDNRWMQQQLAIKQQQLDEATNGNATNNNIFNICDSTLLSNTTNSSSFTFAPTTASASMSSSFSLNASQQEELTQRLYEAEEEANVAHEQELQTRERLQEAKKRLKEKDREIDTLKKAKEAVDREKADLQQQLHSALTRISELESRLNDRQARVSLSPTLIHELSQAAHSPVRLQSPSRALHARRSNAFKSPSARAAATTTNNNVNPLQEMQTQPQAQANMTNGNPTKTFTALMKSTPIGQLLDSVQSKAKTQVHDQHDTIDIIAPPSDLLFLQSPATYRKTSLSSFPPVMMDEENDENSQPHDIKLLSSTHHSSPLLNRRLSQSIR